MKCATCRFGHPLEPEEPEGLIECRRHAPRPVVFDLENLGADAQTEWGWLITSYDQWCGEYDIRVGGT